MKQILCDFCKEQISINTYSIRMDGVNGFTIESLFTDVLQNVDFCSPEHLAKYILEKYDD